MIRLILLIILFCSSSFAGQGMGPGPGFKTYSAGGGGPIAFPVATTSDYTTTTSDTEMSVPVPTDTASGDCLVFLGVGLGGHTISPPAGVTQLATIGTSGNGYVWYRKAGASESAYAFTASGTYSNSAVMALRVTGAVCESTADFTVTTGGSASSSDVAICANITTPEADMAVLWMESGDPGFTSTSNDRGGATERGDMTGGTDGAHLSMWSEPIAAAGAVTGAQVTRSAYSGYDVFSVGIKTQP